MKRCSTCNRTYDDTLSFCLVDGTILSAPYNTEVPQDTPKSGKLDLPPTEVLHDAPTLISRPSIITEHPSSASAQEDRGNQQSLSKPGKKLWIAIGGTAVVVIIILAAIMSSRWQKSSPDSRPAQTSQAQSASTPLVAPAKVERDKALRVLRKYKIGIYFPNRVPSLSIVAKDIQKRLLEYGLKNIQTSGEDDSFFEKNKPPEGDEIRYDPDYEDEDATTLNNVLNEIYPQRSFRKRQVEEGRTENFISIFLGSESKS